MEGVENLLRDYAAAAKEKAAVELEQDPGKINATGTIGRKLIYTDSEIGTGEYGVWVRVKFIAEDESPGWFFSSSEVLVEFFDACKTAELYPFVGIMRKNKGDYGRLYLEPVE